MLIEIYNRPNKRVKPTHSRDIRLCVNRTSLMSLQWSAYPKRYVSRFPASILNRLLKD